MKGFNEISKNNPKKITVKKNYMAALEDANFVKLVNRLDASEEVLIKYTTKLQSTVEEIKNCKGCKGLSYCKNRVSGYINYPFVRDNGMTFDYIPCKYTEADVKEKNNTTYFEVPKFLREAKMSEVFIEKERLELIKYLKEFINKFDKSDRPKGLYLCGSFGSGKSYILSALINEISKTGVNAVMVYYPNLLMSLKAGFNTYEFDQKIEEIMKSQILLLDDIGAENNTLWSRDEILGTILQYRMDNNLSTFFTSNLNLEELETHLKVSKNSTDSVKARRIIERIKYLTNYMELISENKRK